MMVHNYFKSACKSNNIAAILVHATTDYLTPKFKSTSICADIIPKFDGFIFMAKKTI